MIAVIRRRFYWLAVVVLCLSCAACAAWRPGPPTPTPDYAALETQVAQALAKTMTAQAPTPTHTSVPTPAPPTATATPTAMPTVTATPTPETPTGPLVACVRPIQDQALNVVLRDIQRGQDLILTHLTDPSAISDIAWSPDGTWVLFVSGHAFLTSQDNGHNVFRVRPDGTALEMLTGDSLDPATAPGPYAAVTGEIVDAPGPCQVYAQGATGPVLSDAQGRFEITGVPVSATWVRALYQHDDLLMEGTAAIQFAADAFVPITLTLEASGQGWRQADLSSDGTTLVGTHYTWTSDPEGNIDTRYSGVIYDLASQQIAATLENVEDAAINGAVWAPDGGEIIGALTGEESVYLWRWDREGHSLGALMEIPRPDDDLISIAHPAWSPDGSRIAFELRHQFWWSDPATFKTDILIVPSNGEGVTALTNNDWGQDAREPSWSADSQTVYYQLSLGEPNQDFADRDNANLWSVTVADAQMTEWTSDGRTFLPSARPVQQ